MRLHHFFDWDGLAFAAKMVGLCAAIGIGGYIVLGYAANPSKTAPSLVLIQETKPALGKSLSLMLSTTTSAHIINTLTIADAVPPTGKLIAIDLITKVLTLYQDGAAIVKYPILAVGAPGSPEETPAGFYVVLEKESDHFDSREHIDLPWSIQFSGNYFIHGWPYTANGSPLDPSANGGGIRLGTDDAAKVYQFADSGTGIFVYDPLQNTSLPSLTLDELPVPPISANSYLVADIDTGDVLLSKKVEDVFPIGSLTALMTALVANETITADTKVTLPRDPLLATKAKETFFAGDLLYPLLMRSDTLVAASLAQTFGTESFVDWMNASTKALDMPSTHFADATGTSTENVSTLDDLFRLTAHLADKKSFILDVVASSEKDLIASSGNVYPVAGNARAKNALVSVSPLPVSGARRAAIIVLGSTDALADTNALIAWLTLSVRQGVDLAGTACITCAIVPPYRKIQR